MGQQQLLLIVLGVIIGRTRGTPGRGPVAGLPLAPAPPRAFGDLGEKRYAPLRENAIEDQPVGKLGMRL